MPNSIEHSLKLRANLYKQRAFRLHKLDVVRIKEQLDVAVDGQVAEACIEGERVKACAFGQRNSVWSGAGDFKFAHTSLGRKQSRDGALCGYFLPNLEA